MFEGASLVVDNPAHPETLTLSLDGVHTVFLNPRTLGGAKPGVAAAKLLSLAAERCAQRVVVLSAATVEHGGGYKQFADAFREIEDAAKASGLRWTILRCTDFFSNALVWAQPIRDYGVVRGAYGGAMTTSIHEGDVAAAIACALVDAAHDGNSYLLSGPQLLSHRDKVRVIGEVIGVPVAWEEISAAVVREKMIAQGLPPEIPDRMLGYLADRVNQPGPSSVFVETIFGRPARTFFDWVTEHREAFSPK
jgi:uncharacterized protein YbjT (DUF2867 family)